MILPRVTGHHPQEYRYIVATEDEPGAQEMPREVYDANTLDQCRGIVHRCEVGTPSSRGVTAVILTRIRYEIRWWVA